MQREALLNLASIISPVVNQGAITFQPQDDSRKPGLEVPDAIIVDKKPGNKDGTVRKLSSTSTWKQDTGYGVKRECEKSGYVAPTHASTTPRNTSSTSSLSQGIHRGG